MSVEEERCVDGGVCGGEGVWGGGGRGGPAGGEGGGEGREGGGERGGGGGGGEYKEMNESFRELSTDTVSHSIFAGLHVFTFERPARKTCSTLY